MPKKIISTDGAPAAIGPYSQAVRVDNFLFTSGQIPINPQTGEIVQGDIKLQTRQVLENLKVILDAAGTSFERVIKVTVFLTDMNNFSMVNEVYGEYFKENPPARSCVQVSGLPRGADVEIELIALI